MEFEYDPAKSRANAQMHGIDFEQAKALWNDLKAVVKALRYQNEPRFALIAQWNEKVWLAVYTLRGQKIRLISVRRAKSNERDDYPKAQGDDRGRTRGPG
ncbi:MAG: BrnT family toxin [Verrucomicrobia bacterium]|nr:BrnT family toxin [Verrucomicrobiota bacterium]